MTETEVNETAVETEATGAAAESEAARTPEGDPARTARRKTPRRVFGRVVGDGADKTVTVSVERVVRHPVYGKYIRRTTKVMAHDEDNACRLGDRVAVSECRPMSKRKSWRVVEVFGAGGARR